MLVITYAVAGLITGGMYALVAIGLNIQYGLMRVMNIAHGEFLMLAMYLAFFAWALLRSFAPDAARLAEARVR